MFRTHYDLPLQRDVTGRFLPWIIALMVYLAILALAGSMVLSDMAQRWDKGLGRHPDHPGPAPARWHPDSRHPHPGGAGSAACDPRHREGGAAEAGADGEPSGALAGQRRAQRRSAGAGADRRDHVRRQDRCARAGSAPARRRSRRGGGRPRRMAEGRAGDSAGGRDGGARRRGAGRRRRRRHGDFRVAGRAGDPWPGGRTAARHGRPRPLRRPPVPKPCAGAGGARGTRRHPAGRRHPVRPEPRGGRDFPPVCCPT